MPISPLLAQRQTASAAERFAWAAVAAACLGVLGIARGLTADPRGLGTHQQLGLPACQWHSQSGQPCITCGVTTAFVLASQGKLAPAVITQPLGAVLALAVAAAALAAAFSVFFGRSLLPLLAWLWRPSTFFAAFALVLLSWAYKMVLCR